MKINIKNFLKKIEKRIIAILAILILIFTFIDYLIKWRIVSFIRSIALIFWNFLLQNIFEILVLLWLFIITLLLVVFLRQRERKDKGFNIEKTKEELLKGAKDEVAVRIKNLTTDLDEKIKKTEVKLSKEITDEILEVRMSIIDFEIENYAKKGQIGALRKMIEKLELDLTRGWGEGDTLLEIKEYIKKSGCPDVYFTDLNKVLQKVPDDYKLIKEEIQKLAQVKLYKC